MNYRYEYDCGNRLVRKSASGHCGKDSNGDFMSPAVIPKQPLPSMDSLQPSFMPEPPKQLPAVIYPLPQDFWLRCSPAIVIVGLKVALFFIILYAALKCIPERFGAAFGHSGAPGSKLPDW